MDKIAMIIRLKPCLISVDCQGKQHKSNAVKQAFGDLECKFNKAQCIVEYINNPFQVKYYKFLYGYDRLIEAMFDWHRVLNAG